MANYKHDFCTLPYCDRPHKARGYCNSHYQEELKKNKSFTPTPWKRTNQSNTGLTCGWEGSVCDKPARKRGYCNTHYTWHHKNTARPNQRICSIPNCGKPHRGRGYCANHYTQAYQRDKDALMSEGDNFDYEDFWLFVKQELKL
jgi:hypothetical protein